MMDAIFLEVLKIGAEVFLVLLGIRFGILAGYIPSFIVLSADMEDHAVMDDDEE